MAGSGANVIRELLIRLGVVVDPQSKDDAKQLEKQLDTIKDQVSSLASMTLELGKGLAALLVGAAVGAGVLAVETGKDAEAIERQARALNLTRKEYQEILTVFESFGADAGEVADVFQQINDKAIEALTGSQGAVQEFALLGITTQQLKGRRPHEIFELIADGSAKATDKMKSMAGVSKLLGEDSAKKMAPALALGAAGIRDMRTQAHELGLVMDDDALRTAKAAQVEWRKLTMVGRGLRHELGVALAPVVTKVFKGMLEWIRANRELLSQRIEFWVRQVTRLLEGLNTILGSFGGWEVVLMNVAAGTGMLLLLANLDKVEKLLDAVRLAFLAVEAVATPALVAIGIPFLPLLALLGGFVFFLGLAALAVQDFITFWRGGQSVLGDNLDALEQMVPAFKAVRELGRALIDQFQFAWVWVKRYAVAITEGLTPAFELLKNVLEPIVGRFKDLNELWQKLNKLAANPISDFAAGVRRWTADKNLGNQHSTGVLRNHLANQLDRQVGASKQVGAAVDQALPSVVQNIDFHGPHGDSASTIMGTAIRHAGVAVGGGRR